MFAFIATSSVCYADVDHAVPITGGALFATAVLYRCRKPISECLAVLNELTRVKFIAACILLAGGLWLDRSLQTIGLVLGAIACYCACELHAAGQLAPTLLSGAGKTALGLLATLTVVTSIALTRLPQLTSTEAMAVSAAIAAQDVSLLPSSPSLIAMAIGAMPRLAEIGLKVGMLWIAGVPGITAAAVTAGAPLAIL